MILYHGTDSDFDKFSADNLGDGEWGAGFYFVDERCLADGFGTKVKKVRVTLSNPLVESTLSSHGRRKWRRLWKADGLRAREVAMEAGYDGIITDGWNIVVVFSPDQIVIDHDEA